MSVQADVRNDRRGWLRELVAFATNPLLLALLLVSLVPLALMGYATYRSASQTLEVEARGKLTVVREITVKQVERYFAGLHDQLRVLADDPSTRGALADFREGFRTVPAQLQSHPHHCGRLGRGRNGPRDSARSRRRGGDAEAPRRRLWRRTDAR